MKENNVRRIQAVVMETGQTVYVTDAPYVLGILRVYCPYHYDAEGQCYHDDQLNFTEERLQQ